MEINSSYNALTNYDLPDIKQEDVKKIDQKKLKDAAESFEAEFLKILFKSAFKTINETDIGVKAPGKDITKDFMIERYAEYMAANRSVGLAQMIVDDANKKSGVSTEKLDKTNKEILEIK